MSVNVLLDSQGVKIRLTFQSVSDPVRLSAGGKRGGNYGPFLHRPGTYFLETW